MQKVWKSGNERGPKAEGVAGIFGNGNFHRGDGERVNGGDEERGHGSL